MESCPVRICLEFVDDYDNDTYSNDPEQEMYRYPKGCLEFILNPAQTKTLIYIQKTDPWNNGGIGIFKIPRLSVVQLDRNFNVNENYNSNDKRD